MSIAETQALLTQVVAALEQAAGATGQVRVSAARSAGEVQAATATTGHAAVGEALGHLSAVVTCGDQVIGELRASAQAAGEYARFL